MNCFHYPFWDEQTESQTPTSYGSLISPDDKRDFSSGDKMSVDFYELKDTSKMSQEEITKSGLQPVMTQTEMEVNDETFGVGRIKDCGAGLVTVAGSNNMSGILVSIQFYRFEEERRSR